MTWPGRAPAIGGGAAPRRSSCSRTPTPPWTRGCGSARSCASRWPSSTSAAAREQQAKIDAMLDEVGLPRAAVERYPHEFSGGQRQRLGLARALILQPQAAGSRRAGVRAGRVHPGADPQPHAGPAARPGPDLPVHLPRPVRRPVHVGHDRRDVPGQAGRGRTGRRRLLPPGPPLHQGPDRRHPGRRPAGPSAPPGSRAWPGSCRRTSTRRPAAGSAPGARSRRTCAPRQSRRCGPSPPAGTWPPATSRCGSRTPALAADGRETPLSPLKPQPGDRRARAWSSGPGWRRDVTMLGVFGD